MHGTLKLITRGSETSIIEIDHMELCNTRNLTEIFRTGRLSGQLTCGVMTLEIDGEKSRREFILGCGSPNGENVAFYKLELVITAPLEGRIYGNTKLYFPNVTFNGRYNANNKEFENMTMTLSQPNRFDQFEATWIGLPDDEDS